DAESENKTQSTVHAESPESSETPESAEPAHVAGGVESSETPGSELQRSERQSSETLGSERQSSKEQGSETQGDNRNASSGPRGKGGDAANGCESENKTQSKVPAETSTLETRPDDERARDPDGVREPAGDDD